MKYRNKKAKRKLVKVCKKYIKLDPTINDLNNFVSAQCKLLFPLSNSIFVNTCKDYFYALKEVFILGKFIDDILNNETLYLYNND